MQLKSDVLASSGGVVSVYDNDLDNSGGTTGGYGNYIKITYNCIPNGKCVSKVLLILTPYS